MTIPCVPAQETLDELQLQMDTTMFSQPVCIYSGVVSPGDLSFRACKTKQDVH